MQISAGLAVFFGALISVVLQELPELNIFALQLCLFLSYNAMACRTKKRQFYSTNEDGFNNDRSPWNIAENLTISVF